MDGGERGKKSARAFAKTLGKKMDMDRGLSDVSDIDGGSELDGVRIVWRKRLGEGRGLM